MNGDRKGNEKRLDPRISRNFIIRFNLENEESKLWHVSTVQNISKGGCSFFSDLAYNVGDRLDIEIQLPGMRNTMSFIGEVKHCEERVNKAYYLGIKFIRMDETKRNNFIQIVEFFLKK